MTDVMPLPASLRKRFYEPVILLDSLRAVYRKDNKLTEPDLEAAAGKSPQQMYYCFVNKLGQICDNQRGQHLGKTVTSFALLDSGNIEYRFASNLRDRDELNEVKQYVTEILNVLGDLADDDMDDKTRMASVFSRILHTVIAFNRSKMQHYIETLCENDNLRFCIGRSSEEATSKGESVSQALQSLQPHVDAAREAASDDDDAFVDSVRQLLEEIDKHHEPLLEDYMKQKTLGLGNTDSPWCEVRHALGRLLSYFIAIKVLISARKLWPRIFVDVDVNWIPSTEPSPDPPDIRRNARGIIQRMGRNKSTLDAYQQHAESLQNRPGGLDSQIKQRVHPLNFRPIVHAEVNLLDSILRDQAQAEYEGDDLLRFFNEAEFGRYVGSSKPTCLLCHLYFAAHHSGVQCRPTHKNLYYNWRAPDILNGDGQEAVEERNAILEQMVKDIREETKRAIKERSYSRRKHDSRDTPSNPLWSTTRASLVGGVDIDDLGSQLGQINLDKASSVGNRTESSRDTTSEDAGARLERA